MEKLKTWFANNKMMAIVVAVVLVLLLMMKKKRKKSSSGKTKKMKNLKQQVTNLRSRLRNMRRPRLMRGAY